MHRISSAGVIFVDLPTVGDHFKQGVSCASIESVKITSDAIIPVSGEIVAVNEALADAPELLNDSPYDKGWLVRVKPDDANDVAMTLQRGRIGLFRLYDLLCPNMGKTGFNLGGREDLMHFPL